MNISSKLFSRDMFHFWLAHEFIQLTAYTQKINMIEHHTTHIPDHEQQHLLSIDARYCASVLGYVIGFC